MVFTQHLCARCGSEHIRRNGTQGGEPKYQCKAGGYQARFVPAAVAKAAQYAQAEKLLSERNSQRSIVRATGVSRMTIAKLIKKSGAGLAGVATPALQKSPAKETGGPRTR